MTPNGEQKPLQHKRRKLGEPRNKKIHSERNIDMWMDTNCEAMPRKPTNPRDQDTMPVALSILEQQHSRGIPRHDQDATVKMTKFTAKFCKKNEP